MTRSNSDPAIRVLPAEDVTSDAPIGRSTRSPWLLPVTTLLALLAVFFVVTRPTNTAEPPSTTQAPPAIAATEPTTLDFRTRTDTRDSLEWQAVPFDQATQVYDLSRAGAIYVAGGSVPRGAQVWWSTSGTSWETVPTVKPVGKSSIDHIVPWDGDMVALGSVEDGVGIWTSQRPAVAWHYRGALGSGAHRAIGLVAASQLLTITGGDEGWAVWTSTDGVEWNQVDRLTGLDTAQLLGLASDGTAYYAYGATTTTAGATHGAIYRSENGVDWQLVGIEGAADAIEDVAVDGDRLLALGNAMAPDHGTVALRTFLWESFDGLYWERLDGGEPPFAETDVSFAVTATSPGGNPSAVLLVNGAQTQVTVGSTIETDVGTFQVDSIFPGGIALEGDPNPDTYVTIDEPVTFRGAYRPVRIAVEGRRMAIVGSTAGGATEFWLSDDEGATWTRKTVPGATDASFAIDTHGDALLATASKDGTTAWHARWDTTATAADAEDQGRRYLEAIAAHDTDALVALLPATISEAGPQFEVPSLGHETPGWWDDQGNLVVSRVAATMDYLTGTDASLTIDECETSVGLGTSDRADVSCAYTVNSELLRMFSVSDAPGRLHAVLRDGTLRSATNSVPASATMWETLIPQMIDTAGGPVTFSAATAQQHLDAARAYLDGLLQPGETKTADTVLGAMEWSWLEPEALRSVTQPSIVWSSLGFVLTGYASTPGGGTHPVLFTSQEGFDWEQVPVPDFVGNMWQLSAFQDGIVANQWTRDGLGMVYFDGNQWSQITIPGTDPTNSAFTAVAGTDRVLVLVSQYNRYEQGGSTTLYVVNSDLSVTPATPPPPLSIEAGVQFEATENGFMAFVNDPTTDATSVWLTQDEQHWSLLTESLSLDNATFVGNPQRREDRYFVVGQSLERQCTESTAQCEHLSSVWTSPDGTVWHQLRTDDGQLVEAGDTTSGPLGLAAFGFDGSWGRPVSVYLSPDGELWSKAKDIALLGRTDGWWWAASPAVGTRTIVATGTSYGEITTFAGDGGQLNADAEPRLFIVVGRLVDG